MTENDPHSYLVDTPTSHLPQRWAGVGDAPNPPISLGEFLAELAAEEPWMSEANCAGLDPAYWFLDKEPGQWSPYDDFDRKHEISPYRLAVRICGRCPVREECLEFALRTNQRHGIWGGLGEKARRKVSPLSRDGDGGDVPQGIGGGGEDARSG